LGVRRSALQNQNHENVVIYKLAYEIIEQYFSDEVSSISDPYPFDTDPEILAEYRSGSGSSPDPGF
jgi:hypothetical protein